MLYAVKLDVPSNIHPVFYIDLLRRAAEDRFPSKVNTDSQLPAIRVIEADIDYEEGEYRVEEILNY